MIDAPRRWPRITGRQAVQLAALAGEQFDTADAMPPLPRTDLTLVPVASACCV